MIDVLIQGRLHAAPQQRTSKAGKPYCTVCSRLAIDSGIVEFVLWHESGITAYPTDEYNDLSYDFFEE